MDDAAAKMELEPLRSTRSPTRAGSRTPPYSPCAQLMTPTKLMLLVAIVDSCDSALLGTSYPAFQKHYHFTPQQLGHMTMWQALAASVSLPVWGFLLQAMSFRTLLLGAVGSWGLSAVLSAMNVDDIAQALAGHRLSHVPLTFIFHCFLRLINGATLSVIGPIAQAVISEATDEQSRGSAFGLYNAAGIVAGALINYLVLAAGDAWRLGYYAVTTMTVVLLVLLYLFFPEASAADERKPHTRASLADAVKRYVVSAHAILSMPSFALLVLQGVFGGTPWRAIGFLNTFWSMLGFSSEQVARISTITQLGSLFGQVGGKVGDAFVANTGRFGINYGRTPMPSKMERSK